MKPTPPPQRPQSARHQTTTATANSGSVAAAGASAIKIKHRPGTARTRPVGFAAAKEDADVSTQMSRITGVQSISTLTNSTLASVPSSMLLATAAKHTQRLSGTTTTAAASGRRPSTASQASSASKKARVQNTTTSALAGFADTLALEKLHSLLRTQIAVLRRVFHSVDPNRSGSAELHIVRKAIVEALYLDPNGGGAAGGGGASSAADQKAQKKGKKDTRLLAAFDELLRLADPNETGVIEFGRFMRLLRSRNLNLFQQTTVGDDNVDDDEDDELRVRFSGVIFDRRVEARLTDPRKLVKIPIGLRPSGILGDTRAARTPWAVTGDDTRLDHILTSMHREKGQKLQNCLTAAPSAMKKQPQSRDAKAATAAAAAAAAAAAPPAPATNSSRGPGGANPRYSFRQLLAVLRSFDPFIHDAEVKQYFDACPDASATSSGTKKGAASGENVAGNRGNAFRMSGKNAHKTVAGETFFKLFGAHVMTPPAMRSSANFTLGWDMHQTRELARPKYGSMIKQRALEARIHAQVLASGGTATQAGKAVKRAQDAAVAASRGEQLPLEEGAAVAAATSAGNGATAAAAATASTRHVPKPPSASAARRGR